MQSTTTCFLRWGRLHHASVLWTLVDAKFVVAVFRVEQMQSLVPPQKTVVYSCNGKTHWHGDSPMRERILISSVFNKFVFFRAKNKESLTKKFNVLIRGLRVDPRDVASEMIEYRIFSRIQRARIEVRYRWVVELELLSEHLK